MKTIKLLAILAASSMSVGVLAAPGGGSMPQDVTPDVAIVKDAAPKYPRNAMHNKTEGYVVVEYDVDSVGRAENVRVVDSYPEDVFDAAATKAVKRSRYDVQGSDAADGVQRRYDFKLAGE